MSQDPSGRAPGQPAAPDPSLTAAGVPLGGQPPVGAATQNPWEHMFPDYPEPAPRGGSRLQRWRERRPPRPPRPPMISTAPMSRVLSLIEPVIVMIFGALLGLMDQAATETSGWLRVPALVAALLLVAQAISDFQARRLEWITPPAALDDGADAGPVIAVVEGVEAGPVGKAVHRTAPVPIKITPVAQAARENPRVIYFVMGLSVWLALATLANPTAPWPLLVLSLLAAFLLFAEAWQMVRSRR